MAIYKDIIPKFSSQGQIGYGDSEDLDAVKNSLINLFMINKGDVPGKPWLGNSLSVFLFDNIGYFEEQTIKTSFINTIDNFEPRVEIIDLTVNGSPEYNAFNVNLTYYVSFYSDKIYQELKFSLNHNEMTSIDLRKTQGVISG